MFTVGNVLGDDGLRTGGVGCGVGVGVARGAIESDGGRSLVLEFVAGIARACASGVATLNHEFGYDAVKDSAVIKGNAVLFSVRDGICPIFGACSKADEIVDSDRGYLRKQRAMQVASRGVDDGGGLGASSGG